MTACNFRLADIDFSSASGNESTRSYIFRCRTNSNISTASVAAAFNDSRLTFNSQVLSGELLGVRLSSTRTDAAARIPLSLDFFIPRRINP